MASAAHIAVLRQGPKVWNPRLEDNPGTIVDLTGLDLKRAKLGKLIFSDLRTTGEVRVFEANLSGTNLAGADLSEANLSGSILKGADLTGVTAEDANFFGAD